MRETLPELFGDEGHVGVKKAEAGVQHVNERATRLEKGIGSNQLKKKEMLRSSS